MATSFLPRKLIPKHDNISNHEPCTPPMQFLLPRVTLLPSPPPPSSSHDFSPLFTIMFGGLVITLCFICYLTCASRYRRRRTSHRIIDHVTREDFVNEGIGPMITLHPIWLINTPGLDQSQIESIQVFKYKRDEKLIEGTDCSVCLSEFEDDESLRLLPKCSHAFHVPCIDTWLRSHKNCPLCRAPIFNNTNDQTERGIVQSNLVESSTSGTNETHVNDSETIDDHDHDHHVVEVENSEEIAKNDLGDHQHVQGDHELVAMRRSCSSTQFVVPKKPSGMTKSEHKHKGSSSSIHKVTKSSSLGRSLRKASSFTSKCSPYNQSY